MAGSKNTLLAAFLEKDNVKLLLYQGSGKKQERIFAGQITFSEAVLRDAFISDPEKFASQIKIAFAQKPMLGDVAEVILFVPPDKTFTKTIPPNESVEEFIRSLPYFKEELLIFPEEVKTKGKKATDHITYFAFERKLIEDYERPFLDAGRKILGVFSSVNIAAEAFVQEGDYFLLVPSEKEISVAYVKTGAIQEVASFAKEVFAGRFGEFIASHNLFEVKKAFTVGVIEEATLAKVRTERGITIDHLAQADVYDTLVAASQRLFGKGGLKNMLPSIGFPKLPSGLPLQKPLLLLGALLLGFGIVFLILRFVLGGGLPGSTPSPTENTQTQPEATPTPEPTPEAANPADYPIRVLNGTLVTGEAGRLADTLKSAGFEVTETKNATSSAFIATQLRVNSDVPESIVDQLKTLLSETYQTVESNTFSDSTVQVEIIIGRKK